MIIRIALALWLLGAALAIQDAPRTIPPYPGDDNPMHDGQPAWCQNKDGNGYLANCGCKRSCDETDRGSDCKTYCRTSKCKCDHGCVATH